ncbi:MAG: 2Fe-2S iron-sulfur cluster-binding protein, partial [Schleiferiaceae bacterium]
MFLATSTVISAVAVFVVVILALVTILLQAKARLSPSGPVKLNINGDEVEVESGTTLLSTLSNQKIFLPSACGGGGTCGMCK